jgi:predicted ATPase/DNA-binding CsgD family transcriptional regulator
LFGAPAHHPNYVGICANALPPRIGSSPGTRIERADIRQYLPQEPNSFVGRERELDELRKLVGGTRMLTLTGPGGIGKTRLALRTLAVMADEFPDGACYVELADLANPDLVLARVASAVGVTEEHGRPLLDTLADALRPRRLLLALDNCEHLLDACAQLCQRLLASSAELRLLATSREPLRVAGEAVWLVPPLPVASSGRTPGDAVRLFSERAAAAAPGFAPTQSDAGAIAELCRSLDGIPLAIELAAARVRTLTIEQIRMRVADRFALLTIGDRAAPPRQRTLRAAIDWSHDLLTPREHVLLRRLSVFAGWSVEMAELVCSDEQVPAASVLDTLGTLVDKSLVVPEPEALGQARFRMLDTIREYAAEKLTAAGEASAIAGRLRDYVLTVAERNFAVGMGLVPAPWQDRVDVFRQYDVDASNVWLVLSQCLADGDVRTGLRICTAIRPCMLVRGEFDLGGAWVDAFLAMDAAAGVEPGIRGPALIGRAQLTLPVDPADAEPAARAGLDLCRAAGDDFWTAAGLNLLSEIAVHIGRPGQAEELGKEAASIAEAAGDGWNEGWALVIRAAVAGLRGQLREAAELATASIAVMRAIDHRWGVAHAQLGLGDLARTRGDLAEARQRYTEALEYLREINAWPEIARCLSGLGRAATDAGATALAREHLTESLRLSREIGTRIGVARGLEAFAALAVREGDPERAVLLAAASTALREAAGLPPLPGARAERYLALARRRGDNVPQLWARGAALSPEAAIGMALEPPAAPAEPAPAAAAATPPSSLTPRELEIAALVAGGRSNKAIAEELVISPATVARHIANIMAKLGFRSRAQIAAWIADRRLPLLGVGGAGLFHGQLRRRVGFEPLVGNQLAAEHRTAVRARLEPPQRPVDRREPVLQVPGDCLVLGLLGQRQRRVPLVAGTVVVRLEIGLGLLLGIPQQRRHLVSLSQQQLSRPALIHARSLPPRRGPYQAKSRAGSGGRGIQAAAETRWDDHVGRRQVVHRRVTEREQGRVDATAQDAEDVADAGRAAGRQAPQVGAADHDRAGAEGERLHHVAAPAHAAVQQHLRPVPDRRHDGRQRPDGGRRPVQVVAAVVGHRHRGRARVDRAARVIRPHDPLDQERPVPPGTDPGDVVPRGRRDRLPRAVSREEAGSRLAGRPEVRHGEVRQAAVPGPPGEVARPRQHLRGVPEHGPCVQPLRYRRAAPVTAAGERPVERDDQRLRAGRPRPQRPVEQNVTVRRPVHLEEHVRVHPGHVGRRPAGELAQPHRGPGVPGARRDGDLAERMHRLHANRGGDHRQGDVHPEH